MDEEGGRATFPFIACYDLATELGIRNWAGRAFAEPRAFSICVALRWEVSVRSISGKIPIFA